MILNLVLCGGLALAAAMARLAATAACAEAWASSTASPAWRWAPSRATPPPRCRTPTMVRTRSRPLRLCALRSLYSPPRALAPRPSLTAGMPSPHGYRTALRLMQLAEKFHLPVVCYPSSTTQQHLAYKYCSLDTHFPAGDAGGHRGCLAHVRVRGVRPERGHRDQPHRHGRPPRAHHHRYAAHCACFALCLAFYLRLRLTYTWAHTHTLLFRALAVLVGEGGSGGALGICMGNSIGVRFHPAVSAAAYSTPSSCSVTYVQCRRCFQAATSA
jgi:hypothetical protein